MLGPKGSWNTVIVPDSEDERQQISREEGKSVLLDVIEIPSDGDSDEEVKPELQKPMSSNLWTYRNPIQNIGRKVPAVRTSAASVPKKGYGVKFMRSRVIESSDSESDEKPSLPSTHSIQLVQAVNEKKEPISPVIDQKRLLLRQTSSMVVEVDSDLENDGAIIVFDEPKSARKPMRQPPPQSPVTNVFKRVSIPITSRDPLNAPQPETPQRKNADLPTAPESSSPKKKASGTQRVTLKKRKEEQQAQLHSYAASFFRELNLTVFKSGLPVDTKLNWNKRLLTTAGRAKWHRSRDGVQTSEIELAEKILTSRERIRNTLSHEMCHLASWVIDKEIKEGHGRFWKAWTHRVMTKYPDIDISTRHDYEIEYPYKWKCANCDKIKSIKPDECGKDD
ncbi:hypothetical protein EST38_g7416 [Candolleomyces aberdarensis]|uniref:SprT-like domain-containing protein n=1 Tax=Candolleomyces aberdarensis TaxID=2316362 RepID=A0A4Q2DF77_9AGAR|nr:hypothetical protein EST38_g7416 [Candolleomyces aberdarensis]